jgi:SAM-dependent MidA family methyltransferase
VARAIDDEWRRQGCPDPWFVVEAGAGRGTLARAVLDAGPACGPALRYLVVERADALRAEAAERLGAEGPALLLGPSAPRPDDDGEPTGGGPLPGRGPLTAVLADLPALRLTGMVLANELLDNLAFDLVERHGDGWAEVRVGQSAGAPIEVLVPASDPDAADAARLAPDAPIGARIPLERGARAWLTRALDLLDRGRVVCLDYAVASTAELAARPPVDWLRTYRAHDRGGDALDRPGAQDLTVEVCVDQLTPPPDRDVAQADWLAGHGLAQLVEQARAAWADAPRADLEALAARSRISEAAALADRSGLGAFRVLEWDV